MELGTTAYGMLAGLSAGMGLLFLLMGVRKGRPAWRELATGALGIAAAGQILATLALHSAATVDEYETALHGPFTYLGLATLVATSWTIGATYGLWWPRAPIAITGTCLIALALDELTPEALIADEITGLRRVSLFGEPFVIHSPSPGSLGLVLLAVLFAITGYIVAALLVGRRREIPAIGPLSVGIGLAWLANMYDLLVDEGIVGTSYLAPFGLVALVIGLGLHHAATVADTEHQLIDQAATLENLVANRTEALDAAHDDLVAQLRTQNRSALRLAKLSETFVWLSKDGLGGDDLDETLAEVIERLAGLVDATEAHMSWQMPGGPGISVAWDEPVPPPTTPTDQIARVDRRLGNEEVVGQLSIVRRGTGEFSAEERQLVDLAAEYLGSVLIRTALEKTRVHSAVEEERHRIGRDLHDSLSQRLYAAAFNAEAVALSASTDPAFAAARAAEIRTLVLSTLAEIRTLLYELQPEILADLTLTELATRLCDSVGEIYQQDIELTVSHTGPPIRTEPKLALYRIMQESLGNALRHSRATRVGVVVDVDPRRAIIEVADDGIGFDIDEQQAGYGLRNIRERATEAGVGLHLTSDPGSGTMICATWPREAEDTSAPGVAHRFEVAGRPE